ncbi:MAG TPA: tRNA (adenosine(37)-N6)-threonylcarbamoyltransferase complex ATPase subunit type 1 TsaE [Cyclobacteriaceae bacterium]|nr:tRNA (adenosine(37)-N6)-threonylcarbamoyltransferase complex ATPase subunit type 1 TsaE [Cyclobacteriaceae bacterium]
MEILCSGLNELETVAARIFDFGKDYRIWLLKGEIGAGKTTFVHSLARHIGIADKVSSPSFGIINEYRSPQGAAFFHFDLFRINDPQEILDLGFYEYVDSNNYCFIEWPEMIENLPIGPYIEVSIKWSGQDSRIFNVNVHD